MPKTKSSLGPRRLRTFLEKQPYLLSPFTFLSPVYLRAGAELTSRASVDGWRDGFERVLRARNVSSLGDIRTGVTKSRPWVLVKETVAAFISDEALSRGAAIAFYTVTSIAPLLLVVVAIAGLAFGREAAQGAITEQLTGLMGRQTAEVLEAAVSNASNTTSGLLATAIAIATLIATASGAFGEIQAALNAFWKAKPKGGTVSRLLRARAASLGLVATLGFLLVVSLAASAGLAAFGNQLNAILPFGKAIAEALNSVISFVLIAVLFAAIYKVLPDRDVQWGDVAVGASVTSFLFMAGKSLIGWYIGTSAVGSTYGAAGSLIVLLLWVYYSVQIFLLGAEFTKVFAKRHGSRKAKGA